MIKRATKLLAIQSIL